MRLSELDTPWVSESATELVRPSDSEALIPSATDRLTVSVTPSPTAAPVECELLVPSPMLLPMPNGNATPAMMLRDPIVSERAWERSLAMLAQAVEISAGVNGTVMSVIRKLLVPMPRMNASNWLLEFSTSVRFPSSRAAAPNEVPWGNGRPLAAATWPHSFW